MREYPRTGVDVPIPSHADRAGVILVIDDEPQIRRAVRNALAPFSERVLEAGTGSSGLDVAATAQPDLVILDLALPDMEGATVCRDIRSWSPMPIIVLSARHSEDEKVALLTAGADDYITKPFGLRELEARVRVQLRRAARTGDTSAVSEVELAEIRIDFLARRVTRAGEVVRLTPIEWKLLRVLATEAGRTLTHRQIFDAVWARPFGNPQQYLRVHLTNLRRKIEPDPSNPMLIVTEPGIGYRFEFPARSP
jgi:two-component system KDP operon response regulator KdpE